MTEVSLDLAVSYALDEIDKLKAELNITRMELLAHQSVLCAINSAVAELEPDAGTVIRDHVAGLSPEPSEPLFTVIKGGKTED